MIASQLSNAGLYTSSTFTCLSCRSNVFYQDSQAHLTCYHCGTLSLDYTAESFDAEENDPMFTNSQSIRKRSGISLGADARIKRIEAAEIKRLSSPDLLEYLSLYQFSLLMIFKESARILVSTPGIVENELEWESTLKGLWKGYLTAWERANSQCHIMSFFHLSKRLKRQKPDNHECFCLDGKFTHPLFPTKPLLLGFVYLTFRLHRLDVIPADLVRWCERGLIPYNNLWEAIPTQRRNHIKHNYKRVFRQYHNTSTQQITPMSIWFHSLSVARSVNLEVPPLNSPAVALGYILALGFPRAVVWGNYCRIAQIFTSATPLQGIDATNCHYSEAVMCNVMLACMLSAGWESWDLSDIDTNVEELSAVPLNFAEPVEQITREKLSTVLAQFRRNLPSIAGVGGGSHKKGLYLFNKSIAKILSDLEVSVKSVPETLRLPVECEQAEISVAMPSVSRYSDLIFAETLDESDRAYDRNLITPSKKRHFPGSSIVYCSHSRHSSDRLGSRSVAYLSLLERCARHLYCTPLLLHELLERLDRQIIELAMEGEVKYSLQNKTYYRRKQEDAYDESQDLDARMAEEAGQSDAAMLSFEKKREAADTWWNHLRELGLSGILEGAASQINRSRFDDYPRGSWWAEEDEHGDGDGDYEEAAVKSGGADNAPALPDDVASEIEFETVDAAAPPRDEVAEDLRKDNEKDFC